MGETMTVLEVLKITRDNLNKIPIKVSDIQIIGVPINGAVNNLNAVIAAMEEANKPEEVEHEDDNDNTREL